MRWYNPKTRCSEDVPAPVIDAEALEILSGDPNSRAFSEEYEKLRGEGMDVGQALIFVGHRVRLWHLRYQRIWQSARGPRTPARSAAPPYKELGRRWRS